VNFLCGLSLRPDEDTVLDSMLTVAGKLLLLVEAAPGCKCGGNCGFCCFRFVPFVGSHLGL